MLATKLYVPPARPGLVARPRLLERMRAGLSCSLVLVSAQAGYGKSTLLSEWARQNKEQCHTAWVSLDEGDNDPVRFWDYFIAALKTLRPATGETALSLLHSPQPYPTESVLTALINDLTAAPDDLAVILDDYHLIKPEAIHAGITFLLEHLPPKIHLVIATRVDPPLPLSQFRGRGAMIEISADDLRFTLEEAEALLREGQTVVLTEKDVSTLNDRTEGWAVGLKMAGLSMRGQKDIEKFIAAFTGNQRYVMDYLVEQVLKQQPEDFRHFLLTTSVLERLTAPLCDSLTGLKDSQITLEKLESAFGGFLLPLDASRQWYRYHHLLAELLRHQLERVSGAEEVTRLHQRASQWYEENSPPDDSIRHALLARDWERASRLVEAQCEVRLGRGEWNTLHAWLQAVPVEELRKHLRLYVHYANVLITIGQTGTAEAALSDLEITTGQTSALRGEVAFLQMLLTRRRGDIAGTIETAKKAIELLPRENLAMRARASFHVGRAAEGLGNIRECQYWFTDVYELGRQAGDAWTSALGAAHLSYILWLQGRLRQALEIGRQAADLAGESPSAASPLIATATVLYERNDIKACASDAQLALELTRLGGLADIQVWAYELLAPVHLARGNVADAEDAMGKQQEAARRPLVGPITRAIHVADRVMLAIRQGDLKAAMERGQQLKEYPNLEFRLSHVPARLLIARGEKSVAAEELRRLCEKAARADAHGYLIKLRVCQALAAGVPAEAVAFLTEALEMGQAEGYIRTFVDEGKLLKPLLQKSLTQGVTPDYTAKLLNIIEAEERQRRAGKGEPVPVHPSSGFVSGRELEVLRLVAEGLSNQQVAARLSVSLSTAKTHVHRLFEKLNAKDRLQAVTRAKELKLI